MFLKSFQIKCIREKRESEREEGEGRDGEREGE